MITSKLNFLSAKNTPKVKWNNITKDEIAKCIKKARSLNLGINAGHDLNLNNLPHLIESGNVDEVSIGHAIITDALKFGFEDTIIKYIESVRKN